MVEVVEAVEGVGVEGVVEVEAAVEVVAAEVVEVEVARIMMHLGRRLRDSEVVPRELALY